MNNIMGIFGFFWRAGPRSGVLLGRRSGGRYDGLYAPPGGGVEEGETIVAALIRETEEETGLRHGTDFVVDEARYAHDTDRDRVPTGLTLPRRIIHLHGVLLPGAKPPRDSAELADVGVRESIRASELTR